MTVGNVPRVDITRLGAFDADIRHQAEREMAQMHQRHLDNVSEDAYTLMHNGGFLPTEDVHDIIPPWKEVNIMDPNYPGPPIRPPRPVLALTSEPHLKQITRIDKPGPTRDATALQPPPPSVAPVAPPPEPAPRNIILPPFLQGAPRTPLLTQN